MADHKETKIEKKDFKFENENKMPRQVELKHPYMTRSFWENNKFWNSQMYSEENKIEIENNILKSL